MDFSNRDRRRFSNSSSCSQSLKIRSFLKKDKDVILESRINYGKKEAISLHTIKSYSEKKGRKEIVGKQTSPGFGLIHGSFLCVIHLQLERWL